MTATLHKPDEPRDLSLVRRVRDCRCARVRHAHGTIGAYRRDRCRCFGCCLARSQAHAEGRQGDGVLVDSIGVQRRFQALAVMGWGAYRLAAELGVTHSAVEQWRSGHYPTVRRETAAKVALLYDRLWDRHPPGRMGSGACARLAVSAGWVPPAGWDDDLIDDPAASPSTPAAEARDLQPCGTEAAYRRHCRRGETPDVACVAAERRRRAGRAARRRVA